MNKSPRTWVLLVLSGCFSLHPVSLFSQSNTDLPAAPTIRYTVSLASYEDHLLHVQMSLPPGSRQRIVQLPVWNALYQVRDFSQYVNKVTAKSASGAPFTVRKLDKTTWQIDAADDGATVDYEIAAQLPGPYGAEVTPSHAFLNLAEVLMY
jgi:predicted metalloprotease with PDZ domain